MKHVMSIMAATLVSLNVAAQAPQNLWIDHNDRFALPDSFKIIGADSLVFTPSYMVSYVTKDGKASVQSLKSYNESFIFSFGDKVRGIVKPYNYSQVDFTNDASKFSLKRSQESEHFICFWEKGLTKTSSGDISLGGFTINVKTLLADAEKIWDVYVNKLGFLVPGSSITDDVKIEMFIVNQTDWRADGSGNEGVIGYYSGATRKEKVMKVGLFHCNPWAATARGGHTVAHEIGHTFQYLVSADLGMEHGLNYVLGDNSSGNEWWEDCANWQAYKVYPSRQFSDGEYFEGYMNTHHLNIHHEAGRYNNCFYHDWWCQQHGQNTIGRVWRESNRPEDPSEAYMRIFGLTLSDFADDMYQCYAHFTSIDIDGVRVYGRSKIGREPNRLVKASAALKESHLDNSGEWWVVDPAYCVQNFGYNATPLTVPAVGSEVKVSFRGITGAPGYRNIKPECEGWRYGIAAYCSDGKRYYSEMKKDKNGEVTMTVPEKCVNMWFVVMGAPTQYWRHSWNDYDGDDEQWPYAAKFEGTTPRN